MRFCVLGSGSKGNSTFIEGGGTRLLIDAGFSGIEMERRLAAIEIDIATISAIMVTHAHSDHAKGVGVLSRKIKNCKVFCSRFIYEKSGWSSSTIGRWEEICYNDHKKDLIKLDGLAVRPFPVEHSDSDHSNTEAFGFVISDGRCSIGYCTDTGKVTPLIRQRLSGCNGLILECNHDLEMLKNGGYPPSVQQRIRSDKGHLRNEQTAELLVGLIHEGLEHVVLAHISETNNTHDLARETVERHLREYELTAEEERRFRISVARQDVVGELVCLGGLTAPEGLVAR